MSVAGSIFTSWARIHEVGTLPSCYLLRRIAGDRWTLGLPSPVSPRRLGVGRLESRCVDLRPGKVRVRREVKGGTTKHKSSVAHIDDQAVVPVQEQHQHHTTPSGLNAYGARPIGGLLSVNLPALPGRLDACRLAILSVERSVLRRGGVELVVRREWDENEGRGRTVRGGGRMQNEYSCQSTRRIYLGLISRNGEPSIGRVENGWSR